MIGCDYNRFITFQTPTDVNTEGSVTQTWATSFTCWAKKESRGGVTEGESGKRTTTTKETWKWQYNSATTKDGRFFENSAATSYYYVTNVTENDYQVEQ